MLTHSSNHHKHNYWFGQSRKKRQSLIKALQVQDKKTQQSLWQTAVSAFTGRQRQQQLETLNPEAIAPQISDAERQANRNLAISLGSMAAVVVGNLGFPLLVGVGAAGIIYLQLPFVKQCYVDLVQKQKLNSLIIYPLLVSGSAIGGFWFEASVGITAFQLARKLLAKTRHQSRQNLSNIMGTQPHFAWVLVDGVEIRLPFAQIEAGDVIVIGAGQTVPIDGIIVDGIASIDQHALTGESQPAEKEAGDEVLAATTVLSGKIFVRVTKTGNETVAAKIGEILNNSADFELTAVSRSDKIIDDTLIPTLILSVVAFPIAGVGGSMGVLLAGFGYNLRLLSPISMLNFLQIFSDRGVLIKDGRSLETLASIDTIVFDKTGTLTLEQPHVANIHTFGQLTATEVLSYAAAAEDRQSHPIAKAILAEAKTRQLVPPPLDHASYEVGYGLKVTIQGGTLCVGSDRFMTLEGVTLPATAYALQEQCQGQGYSLVMVALNQKLVGAIEIHPTIRPEAAAIVANLKARGLHTVIISGDQEEPTRRLAQELAIDTFFANTLPENKATLVEQLQSSGKTVCFVGDGINDAIALRQANVSVSLRGAASAATDTAQIVFMDGDLVQLPPLLDLGQKFERNMDMNLAWSIIPGVVILGGIFIFHASFLSVVGLMNLGLGAGVVNAMLPLWQVSKQD
ncbi:MAG: heavy metal translocating P-type ATPase [Chloroflexota bacterium]